MIVMCCVCRRVLCDALGEPDPERDAIWMQPLDKDPSQPRAISDSYCPRCAKKLKAEADKLKLNPLPKKGD